MRGEGNRKNREKNPEPMLPLKKDLNLQQPSQGQ
jgi:hypothetical protein